MFEEFLNRSVKVVYDDGGKVRAVYGVLEGANEFLKIRMFNGRLVLIGKEYVIRVTLSEKLKN